MYWLSSSSLRWIRSAFGFGEALIAVPLLALLIPVEEAVPLATLISIIVAAIVLVQDWQKVHLRSASVLAGIFGGAHGMNGPPLVIYGALRRWSPEHFRATLQGYFLPASIVGLLGYWLTGLWVGDVTCYYLFSLPVALAAIVLGRWINRKMKSHSFIVYVHVGLILVGSILSIQAVWKHLEIVGM